MKSETIERSSGNIFADLGLENPSESLFQADLALAIARIIRERGWTQTQAAAGMRVAQSDVSNIMRGKLSGFSIERLSRLLERLDHEIEIVVRPKRVAVQWQGISEVQTLQRASRNIPFIPVVKVEHNPCPPGKKWGT